MTYTIMWCTLLAVAFIGIAFDIREHRNAKLDREFQEWLARGIHPSLWRKTDDGS